MKRYKKQQARKSNRILYGSCIQDQRNRYDCVMQMMKYSSNDVHKVTLSINQIVSHLLSNKNIDLNEEGSCKLLQIKTTSREREMSNEKGKRLEFICRHDHTQCPGQEKRYCIRNP